MEEVPSNDLEAMYLGFTLNEYMNDSFIFKKYELVFVGAFSG